MSDSDQVFVEIMAMVVAAVVMAVLFVCRRPKLLVLLVASTAVWWALRVPGLVVSAIALAAALGVWRLVAPRSFRRLVSGPAGRARRRRRYRRMWPALTAAHRLSWAPHPKTEAGRQVSTWDLLGQKPVTPKLERVDIGAWVDRLRVRMLPGQIPADWEEAAEGIAHALGARDGRIRVAGPGRITIELAHSRPAGRGGAGPRRSRGRRSGRGAGRRSRRRRHLVCAVGRFPCADRRGDRRRQRVGAVVTAAGHLSGHRGRHRPGVGHRP